MHFLIIHISSFISTISITFLFASSIFLLSK